MFLLMGAVSCRNFSNRGEGEGFNPGQSDFNPGDQQNGGSGYNAGDQPNVGSGYNSGDQPNGGSGYNTGDQQNGGSGYNSGDQQNNQFNPHIPDFIPDESITNSGSSGFNS